MSLKEKIALITGSGGDGVGATIALELASRGASVIVNYRQDREKAQAVVHRIEDAGGQAIALQADLMNETEVEGMVAEIAQRYGRLDIMVSTKGGNNQRGQRRQEIQQLKGQGGNPFEKLFRKGSKSFLDLDWESLRSRVEGELRAAFTVTKAVAPLMVSQRYGRLVYLSGEHSRGPAANGMIANGTAKAALNTFVLYLAHELGASGITANLVSPAMVEVNATRWMQSPDFIQRITAATPLGRIARPDDIAKAVAFFASDDSAFMTGVYAPVTGGFGLSRLS